MFTGDEICGAVASNNLNRLQKIHPYLKYINKIRDNQFSITITNHKGQILSIDTWSKEGSPITQDNTLMRRLGFITIGTDIMTQKWDLILAKIRLV